MGAWAPFGAVLSLGFWAATINSQGSDCDQPRRR